MNRDSFKAIFEAEGYTVKMDSDTANAIVNDHLDKMVHEHSYNDHVISARDVACGVDYINEIRHHITSGDSLTAMVILDLLVDIVTGERHCDSE